MRKEIFVEGEYYHIYNRGTDKRIVFKDFFDLMRFFISMEEFNTIEPIGGIYNNRLKNKKEIGKNNQKLVDIICYCLNSNHFHFILSPLVERGIEKFMHKLGTGYTMYFNEKYDRSGALFQGTYKAIWIDSDEYLMYLSAYVNLNNKIHRLGGLASKSTDEKIFWKSSWKEYLGENDENFCNKNIVLGRYEGKINDYKKFAEDVVQGVIKKRYENDINFDKSLFIEKL